MINKPLGNIGQMPIKQETLSDALLRKFLLGDVHDEERDRIENLFLIHPETRQRILDAEQDLIEDYLENSLTAADREIFLSRYVRTAKQRQSVTIVKLIKELALAGATSPHSVSGETTVWSGLRERLRVRLTLLVPVAVAIVIVMVIALGWLNSMQRERLAVELELAQLNAPASLHHVSSQVVSLELSPVTLRSAQGRIELNTRTGVQFIELRLPWFQKERFSACEAEIRRVGGDESFTIRNVLLEGEGRYTTRIRLPARILRPGQYQIRLNGISVNGEKGLAEEYQFVVGN